MHLSHCTYPCLRYMCYGYTFLSLCMPFLPYNPLPHASPFPLPFGMYVFWATCVRFSVEATTFEGLSGVAMLTAGFLGESLLWGPGVFGLLPPSGLGPREFSLRLCLGDGERPGLPLPPLEGGGLVTFRPPITLGGGRSIHFG